MSESGDLDHSAQAPAPCGTDGERVGESGATAPRRVQDPRAPTRAEVDAHNMTHLPYRPWSTHCVRRRREAHPHRKSGDEERDVPELHMDSCFMARLTRRPSPFLSATILPDISSKKKTHKHKLFGYSLPMFQVHRFFCRLLEARTHCSGGS